MTWKLLSWAIHQIFGTKKGDSIMAALKDNQTAQQIIAMGDDLIERKIGI